MSPTFSATTLAQSDLSLVVSRFCFEAEIAGIKTKRETSVPSRKSGKAAFKISTGSIRDGMKGLHLTFGWTRQVAGFEKSIYLETRFGFGTAAVKSGSKAGSVKQEPTKLGQGVGR